MLAAEKGVFYPKTFTCFVFLDLVCAVQSRGLRCGLFQNKMLTLTISTSLGVLLALVYVPFMQTVFQTEALASRDIRTLVLLAATSFLLHEGRRRYERSIDADLTYNAAMDEIA